MFRNKLKLNPDKTKFLAITSDRNKDKVIIPSPCVKGEVIPRSDFVKNIGVHIDSTLTFQSQINHLRKTCYFVISWISKARPYITQEAAKTMAHSLVTSRIDYCNVC